MLADRKTKGIILAAVLVVLLQGAASAVEKPCGFCHADHCGIDAPLKKDINELCSGCHEKRISRGEHKVGVKPSKSPAGIPLQGGIITCVSCHDPHSKSSKMLRMAPEKLCIRCHEK